MAKDNTYVLVKRTKTTWFPGVKFGHGPYPKPKPHFILTVEHNSHSKQLTGADVQCLLLCVAT